MARKDWTGSLRWIAVGTGLVWVGLVLAYGTGFLATRPMAGMSLVLNLAALALALFGPLVLLWAVVRLSLRRQSQDHIIEDLKGRISSLERQLAARPIQSVPDEGPESPAPPPTPQLQPTPEPQPQPQPSPTQTRAAVQIPVNSDRPDPAMQDDHKVAIPSHAAAAAPEGMADTSPDDGVTTQPMLPFADDGTLPLSTEETIRALNFPQDAQDRAGFEILARALARHDLARLLQASEDCLNFLAHLGLYMDDLLPAPASPADWRQFSKGGRARAALLPLNGIRDQAALDAVRMEMRADPIFRDAALHFQRRFDQMLSEFEPTATDTELLDLIDTRTGRAFILLAQVAGTLDRPA